MTQELMCVGKIRLVTIWPISYSGAESTHTPVKWISCPAHLRLTSRRTLNQVFVDVMGKHIPKNLKNLARSHYIRDMIA